MTPTTERTTPITTLAAILDRHGINVADDLLATIEVPVISDRPQRQGDVGIFPIQFADDNGTLVTVRPPFGKAELDQMTVVPAAGINVVVGEATGNRHILSPDDPADRGVLWFPAPARGGSVLLGLLRVMPGSVANLIHTDEHGANATGPGDYILNGKREMVEEIRRVAD